MKLWCLPCLWILILVYRIINAQPSINLGEACTSLTADVCSSTVVNGACINFVCVCPSGYGQMGTSQVCRISTVGDDCTAPINELACRGRETNFECESSSKQCVCAPGDQVCTDSIKESMKHSSTIKLTLENTYNKPVHYKFRWPPTKVIEITPPGGKIPSSGKTEVSLSYDASNNIGMLAMIPFQLKYVQVEKDDKTDTQTVFTDRKSDTQSRAMNVTFQDEKEEDAFFLSPMSKTIDLDDNIEEYKTTWWRKTKK